MTPPRDARLHTVVADDGALLRGWAWEPAEPRGVVIIRTPYGPGVTATPPARGPAGATAA